MKKAAAALTGLLLLFLTPGIASSETQAPKLTVLTSRIIFDKSSPDFQATKAVAINVSGSQRAIVKVYLEDKVVIENGSSVRLPFGSTESSLDGVMTIEPNQIDYIPNAAGSVQQFIVRVSVKPERITKPMQGEFLVTLTPTIAESGKGASFGQALAIGYTAVAVPTVGEQSIYSLKIRNESLSVVNDGNKGLLDLVIPDLPRLISSGPVTMKLSSQNSGDLPLDKRAIFKIHRINLFDLFSSEEPEPYYTISGEPKLVLAGANFSSSYSSQIKIDNGPDVDSLPFIGLVRFEATAEGKISGLAADLENETIVKYYLVFPWKLVLVVLVLALLFTYLRFRKKKKSVQSDEACEVQSQLETQTST
jgi:hypothetical protein